MNKLTRFWFVFERNKDISALNIGCGVTAWSKDDAVEIMRVKLFGGGVLPPVKECIEDVDISMLDNNHVIPNMGLASKRGIWFPLGYS